ncbi:uncharacterized protein LOC124410295 isoform X2 [Diprion similis]|uniref:uncharacterized protein LOC124410295 isoform X2 n=1 Tax=Diprion similis TaxID=362088 RepID=UPI001EF93E9F|nr:uncharacterized protein LOC124410295 isoform X2 [Diprion similis]
MKLLIICSVFLCLVVLQAEGHGNANKVHHHARSFAEHSPVTPLIPREKKNPNRNDLQSYVLSKFQEITNLINQFLIRIHDCAEKIGFHNLAKLVDDISAALQEFIENVAAESGGAVKTARSHF